VTLEPMMVVLRGWIGWRVFKFTVALLAAGYCTARLAPGLGWIQADGGTLRVVAGFTGCSVLAGVLSLPWLRYRREYVLDANGITQWESDARAHNSEWARVGWDEIAEWSARANERLATFLVVAGDGRAVGLTQRPPGKGTVELIRRLTHEVDRHPRAARLPYPATRSAGPERPRRSWVERMVLLLVSFLILGLANGYLIAALGLRLPPGWVMATAMAVLFLAYRLGMQLDDSDLAYVDRGGRTWRRRTRNRLRRLFGLRHV
jgi:hypothetical protein